VRQLLDQGGKEPPTHAELAAYYQRRRAELTRPERVHLRQILVESRSEALAALAEIRAGADFGEVAKRRSTEPAAALGGEQGVLARTDLPASFAASIFVLGSGEVSDIVPADYGFHIFQVLERYPAQELSFAEAEPELVAELDRERRDRRLAALVAEARDEYNPVIYEQNLPFNYIGAYAPPG
jgi:parvulin-like peptidyl-prolyl isomerase